MSQDLSHLDRYARQGDAQAFDTLVRQYQGLVYSVCLRHLGDEADAQDATQETFLTLARKAASVRSNLAGWLHGCARQTSLDMLRRQIAQRKRDTESARARTDVHLDPSPSWSEVRIRLDEAMAELDEPTRELLVERFFVGRSQQELATDAGVSQSLMSRRINAAVDRLRSLMVRKGVTIPAAALAAGLLAESAQAASVPAKLTASLSSIGLSGVHGGGASTSSNIVFLGVTMNVKAFVCGVVIAAIVLGGGTTYFVAQKVVTAADRSATQPATQGEVIDESVPTDQRWPGLGVAKIVEIKPGQADDDRTLSRDGFVRGMTIEKALVEQASTEGKMISWNYVIDESGKKLLNHPYRFSWSAPAGQRLSESLPLAFNQLGVICLRSIQSHFNVRVVYERRKMAVLLLKLGSDAGAALKSRLVSHEESKNDSVHNWSEIKKIDGPHGFKRMLMTVDTLAINIEGVTASTKPVINDTGLPEEAIYDVAMPAHGELRSEEDLKTFWLKKYNLKLEPGVREIEVMVIKPASAK